MEEYKKHKVWIIIALFLIFIYKTDLYSLSKIVFSALYPVILALIISWFLIPQKSKAENFLKKYAGKFNFINKYSSPVSAFAVYILFLSSIAFFILYLIPILKDGLNYAYSEFSKYYYIIENFFGKETIINFFKSITPKTYITGAKETISFVFKTFTSVIILIYILLEHRELKKFAVIISGMFIGNEKTEKSLFWISKTNAIFIKYFYGKLISSIMLGVIVAIGLIILNVSHPIFFSFIVAISNMIPFFGPIIGVIPIILNAFAEYGITKAVIVIGMIVLSQEIENNILTPKVVGNTIGISGFWTLFSVVLGGGIFGIWGMFISIPVAGTIKMIYAELKKSRHYLL